MEARRAKPAWAVRRCRAYPDGRAGTYLMPPMPGPGRYPAASRLIHATTQHDGRKNRKAGGPNTPHSVLGVICLGIAPGGQRATACLAQLHPPAFACAATSPSTALGSYSQLSPITGASAEYSVPSAESGRGPGWDGRPLSPQQSLLSACVGWSPLCCTWPRGDLAVATAHLAVSVGWLTPRRVIASEGCGEVPLAIVTGPRPPATPGSRAFPGSLPWRPPSCEEGTPGAEGEI